MAFTRYLTGLFICFLILVSPSLAQQTEAVRVFLDCNRCDRSYIRQEVSFVDYVRDKEDADVHLLITRQTTGSGGTEFTLRFIGRSEFSGQDNTLIYVSPNSDTQDEERIGLVRYIKIGLIPYVSETSAIDNLDIIYDDKDVLQTSVEENKWNNWVFELGGNAFFNGEESRNSLFLSGGVSADRVTEDWKINLGYDYDYNRRAFTDEDSLGNNITDVFITRGQRFDGRLVKSISNHWSAGIFTEAFSSSRNNIDLSLQASPALEYNIFPYREYAQREISFLFLVSSSYFDYDELTIFNERSEFLIKPQIRSRMDFTQPWGEIEGRLNLSAFMHDFSKNRVDLRLEFDFRVFRGLDLSIDGRYSLINDQLSIPKGDISDAEQLLNLRQQLTSYSFGGSIGIEYSFGSIYNNVVNPRF
ncbi:MAG TPA: hypothetical protein VJ905_04700 [Halalkalibaculum sp.]|nr:hypothetical protein [Halalkalibaculum sp.]